MSNPDPPPPAAPAIPPSRIVALGRLWFGLRAPVDRMSYWVSGLTLMLFKYVCDASLVFAWTRHVLSPIAYLAPSGIVRAHEVGVDFETSLSVTMALFTLPFLWIGLTMCVRRAADAGRSPWLGFLFLLPVLNHLAMIYLGVLPSRAPEVRASRPPPSATAALDKKTLQTLTAVLVPIASGLAMGCLSIFSLRSYGGVLLFATPCFMGAQSAYLSNRVAPRSLISTVLLALLSVVAAGVALLLFGVEGFFCLLMALPIAAALALPGAVVGWALMANARRLAAPVSLWLVALPGSAALENAVATPTLRQVTTTVEVDAPPERVFSHVIGFSEIPPPSEWVFRAGIAYPIRARLDGEGVGAVRRCEFSTGAFVEPITAWEPPRRLAFDVTAQPPSMIEWSPYRDLRAPHLEGYMVSRRGEFRLVPLPHRRTRLEGTTWYTLSIYPENYWVIYADILLHRIHQRVLDHIKSTAER